MSEIDINNLTPEQLEEKVNNGTLFNQENKNPVERIDDSTESSDTPPDTEPKAASISQGQIHSELKPERENGFDIKDPVELLFLLDENILSGKTVLHDWQIQFLLDFAAGGQDDDKPFQALVRACNGSGKDKYIIAPCVVWLCMRFLQARCVVTSASGVQLDNQTDTYINQLCYAANQKIAPNIWKLNYRYYECLATGSPVTLFATDEAGKAEGYHPLVPDGKMGIFQSESKSVSDEINNALNRCTGYTHRVHVSTPGLPMGHFYDYCSISTKRKEIQSIEEVNPIDYVEYHVTAYDCSHLSKNYIEQCKRDLPGGESGAAFKSIVLAEFGTTDEQVVIPYHYVWKAVNNARFGHLPETYNTGGLDLSAGGDETVFSIRNGNQLTKVIPFRFDNTQDTVRFLEEKFKENGFLNPQSYIFADAGGLGKPIIDQLRARGWTNIRYVLNQSKAYDERVYLNRGAEMWFRFGKLLETGEIWLCNDPKLIRQLSTRYYKITEGNKHQLESKLAARAKGHPSPDRADSVVLAFCTYKSKLEEKPYEKPFAEPESEISKSDFCLKTWATGDYDQRELHPSRGKQFRDYDIAIARHNKRVKETSELISI